MLHNGEILHDVAKMAKTFGQATNKPNTKITLKNNSRNWQYCVTTVITST